MTTLSEAEIQTIAKAAAREAVRETLLAIGVDVSKPEAIQEAQKDFLHLRGWRQSVDTVRRQGLLAAVGIVVAGIAGAIWAALKVH